MQKNAKIDAFFDVSHKKCAPSLEEAHLVSAERASSEKG